MNINENMLKIYQMTAGGGNPTAEISIISLERNFLVLMSLLDYSINNSINHTIDPDDEWGMTFSSNIELAFNKKQYFSKVFVAYYEIWFQKDDHPERIVMGSQLNDFCLSQSVYQRTKNNKKLFETYWDGDQTSSWEWSTYLFERYGQDPFSLDRYNRVHG